MRRAVTQAEPGVERERKGETDAGVWRCSGGAEFPDQDVTQVAGHQEPAIELRSQI